MRLRSLLLFGLVVLAVAGCRAPASTAEQKLPTPTATPNPPVAVASPNGIGEGSYSVAPFAAGATADAAASTIAQASAAAPCATEPPPATKRGWRNWLPTKDHSNDPRRERGQFADGWYEPEYRGMSD